MISRIPADVVRPGEPQKRPNSRWSDGESKTGFSLSFPGREPVFQPTLPRRVSQFSIPWILARARTQCPSAQNGHRRSHRYGPFCLVRLISRDGEVGESHWKIADSIKSWADFRGSTDSHPPHVTVLKRSARRGFWMLAPCRRKRPDHQQPIRKLTRRITSLFLGVLPFFFHLSVPFAVPGLLYFCLHSRTVLILRNQSPSPSHCKSGPPSPNFADWLYYQPTAL